MGIEIDFLPVGDGERSGDAIALRFGDLISGGMEQYIVVIDGGTKKSGKELVAHIKKHYNSERVDLVINTHPHSDHTSGLTEVIENLQVSQILMHLPWKHSEEYKELFKSGRITESSLESRLQESLNSAYDISQMADERGIPIIEPFSDTGITHPNFTVLGPSTEYYETQLANFSGTPIPKDNILVEAANYILEKVKETVEESWDIETLGDPDENDTSPENNSGAIVLINYEDSQLLFTGDAGVGALVEARNKADEFGIDLLNTKILQLPHHGSKHNIGKSLLDNILGPIVSEDTESNKTVLVSCAKESKKHPNTRVTNACIRRGAKVIPTQGVSKCHYAGERNNREGWVLAEPLPFVYSWEE